MIGVTETDGKLTIVLDRTDLIFQLEDEDEIVRQTRHAAVQAVLTLISGTYDALVSNWEAIPDIANNVEVVLEGELPHMHFHYPPFD